MSFLQSIPAHWVSPLASIIMVFGAILLLYPLIWKLTIRQLSAALKAVETAKELPELATKIEDLGSVIRVVEAELRSLEERLPQTDVWTEKLESLNRLASDLQQRLDALPSAAATTTAVKGQPNEAAIREEISNIWRDIKSDIETKIEHLDGRRRRKYASVTRYTYEEVADLLFRDEQINKNQLVVINKADSKYRSLRNGKLPVSSDTLKEFQSWRSAIGE